MPSLLDKDILIDRRRTSESTPAVSGATLPSFGELTRGPATPPGMIPARQQAHAPQGMPPPVPQAPPVSPPLEAPQAHAAPQPPPMPQPQRLPVPAPMPALQTSPAAPAVPLVAPAIPAPAPRSRPVGAPQSASGLQEVHARPASLWRRLLSFTIDAAAITGVATLYILLASSIAGVKPPSSQGLTPLDSLAAWMHALEAVLLPGFFLLLVLATVYCAVAAFLWNGRTLGRLLLGLRLVDTHGLAPAPTRAIVRALLSVVSFGLFLGGFWMALFDRRGQTLHDKLTSTFVVQPS